MFSVCDRYESLLVIHVGGVSRCERNNLIAGPLLVFRRPIGPDEGVQVSVDGGCRLGAVLQIEQVEVGLGAVHLRGGAGQRP